MREYRCGCSGWATLVVSQMSQKPATLLARHWRPMLRSRITFSRDSRLLSSNWRQFRVMRTMRSGHRGITRTISRVELPSPHKDVGTACHGICSEGGHYMSGFYNRFLKNLTCLRINYKFHSSLCQQCMGTGTERLQTLELVLPRFHKPVSRDYYYYIYSRDNNRINRSSILR